MKKYKNINIELKAIFSDFMKKPIYLRGHHLLCLQGYQGYGYDENFKKNLELILIRLKEEKIRVISSFDSICESCPKLKDKMCILNLKKNASSDDLNEEIKKSNNEIVEMDLKVIDKIAIDENKTYTFEDLKKIINNKIKTKKDLEKICGNCMWIEECLFYQSKNI